MTVEPVGEISPWSGTWLVGHNATSVFLERTPRCRPEALLVEALWQIDPETVPAVIAADVTPSTIERWFLLADAGGCDRAALPADVSAEVARALGSFQRRCAGETRVRTLLQACGSADLRDVALSCCQWALLGDWPPAEAECLRAAEEVLLGAPGAARRIEAILDRVPPTVVHGDVWAGNVARSNGRVVFVDWGSALWGVGSIDIVNLVACRPSALDGPGAAGIWDAFAEGLGVELDEDFRQASAIAYTVASVLIDRAIAESIERPPQWLRGIVPAFKALLLELDEWGP